MFFFDACDEGGGGAGGSGSGSGDDEDWAPARAYADTGQWSPPTLAAKAAAGMSRALAVVESGRLQPDRRAVGTKWNVDAVRLHIFVVQLAAAAGRDPASLFEPANAPLLDVQSVLDRHGGGGGQTAMQQQIQLLSEQQQLLVRRGEAGIQAAAQRGPPSEFEEWLTVYGEYQRQLARVEAQARREAILAVQREERIRRGSSPIGTETDAETVLDFDRYATALPEGMDEGEFARAFAAAQQRILAERNVTAPPPPPARVADTGQLSAQISDFLDGPDDGDLLLLPPSMAPAAGAGTGGQAGPMTVERQAELVRPSAPALQAIAEAYGRVLELTLEAGLEPTLDLLITSDDLRTTFVELVAMRLGSTRWITQTRYEAITARKMDGPKELRILARLARSIALRRGQLAGLKEVRSLHLRK